VTTAIVLYDGACGLCSAAVHFALERDTAGALRFAPLESTAARDAAAPLGGVPAGVDSIVVLTDGRLLLRSAAALAIAQRLRMPWPVLAGLASVVPRAVRDAVYDLIARHRHRFFPARACLLPTDEQRSRFL
jgi:predicted DCC family thiol-disulfide oxidoreductase YuxK